MALLPSGISGSNGLPPYNPYPTPFTPNNRLGNFGRNDKQDHNEYFHHVTFDSGKKHPIQDKFNYVKNLIHEKLHKKLHRGHYEHSAYESNKDQSAAISALTLLAFLFFLYILQSCIKEHVNQIMADTTTAAPTVGFREMRQSTNERDDVDDDYYYYSEEGSEEISVKLPIVTTPTTALQIYKSDDHFNKYFDDRNMEPVRLITKP